MGQTSVPLLPSEAGRLFPSRCLHGTPLRVATGHQFGESDEPKITGHQESLANNVGRLRSEEIQLGSRIAMAECIQQRAARRFFPALLLEHARYS